MIAPILLALGTLLSIGMITRIVFRAGIPESDAVVAFVILAVLCAAGFVEVMR